ncbi:MAG: transcription antitermination factor NusB [Candidatus Vogelbacteria bacterium]|nr:transcription antitermination factor NusB [Candidatus Vogelbacteria bacterium]
MANRHLSRSLVVQSLFEWDFNSLPPPAVRAIFERNQREFASGLEDGGFSQRLVDGVMSHQPEIDKIIAKAAPEWPLEKIAITDRNVLRLGLYELLFADRREVPARVAINEAIELAKAFGGEASGKFVNGVLGTVYKELGEPGKDEVPVKKRRIKEARYEDLPVETLGGAVIYARRPNDGVLLVALVHDIFGYWTLSKGHIEPGEDARTGTRREVREELSLEIKINAEIGSNEYLASDPAKGKIRKQVTYFLGEAEDLNQLHLNKNQGLDDARWFPAEDILMLKMYDDILPIVTKAIKLISDDKQT